MPRNRFCKQGCSLGKAKQAYWILISEALLGKGGGEKDDECP